ncbi:hypothetical protein ACMFMF_001019 [Clarireedia jacksonii]
MKSQEPRHILHICEWIYYSSQNIHWSIWMMDELSAQSSPTLRSPLFLLRQSFPHTDLDLSNTLLSDSTVSMENEGTPRPATTPIKTPDSTKSQFFDLQPPTPHALNVKIEDLAKRLFSNEHLLFILQDHALFQKFSIFINKFKPHLVPALVRYLEMRKAIKAIEYANAVAQKIRWPFRTDFCKFSDAQAAATNVRFDDYGYEGTQHASERSSSGMGNL